MTGPRGRSNMWSGRARALVLVLAVAALAACGGGSDTDSADRQQGESTSSTSTTTPTTTTTTLPDVSPAPTPVNVHDDRVEWYTHPAPGSTEVLLGVVRSPLPGPHPAIVLVPGSDGFTSAYIDLAQEFAARGFDVGTGCWWANVPIPDESPASVRILCSEAPSFKGVVDGAVPDLDSLVEGVAHILGNPSQVAVLGFSRGGGIAALRAAYARPEAVISVSGMLEGWNGIGSTVPGGEVNVVERTDGITAPVLILHGAGDTAVPVEQAYRFEEALRAGGKDVEAHYYEGLGHGLFSVPAVRADMIDRIAGFLCGRFPCGA